MADLYILPQATYQEPSPQGRRRQRELNTIMEDDKEDEVSPIRSPFLRKKFARVRKDRTQDRDKIQAWLAPLEPTASEDVLTPRGFPTPKGRHFMSAPTLPSSPSSASYSGEEDSWRGSSCRTDSWQRQSVMTDVTEFDDLYGVSDAEVESPRSSKRGKQQAPQVPPKTALNDARKALPQLQIPGDIHLDSSEWPAAGKEFKKHKSPVPPTPPSAVAMSPAMFSFMKAQHANSIPTVSTPPSLDGSLDGSLTSEQLAAISAPSTPVIAGQDPRDSGDWAGVRLQPGALETLQALSGHESEDEIEQHHQDQFIEVPRVPMTESRPSRPRLWTSNVSRTSFVLSPAQQRSMSDLTRLDIPSPGGFFSGLSPRTRTTWHYGMSPADDVAPPTSTTAEQFYRTPWSMDDAPPMPPPPAQAQWPLSGNISSSPVEQVVEMFGALREDEEVLTAMRIKSPLTAIKIPQTPAALDAQQILSPQSPRDEHAVTEIIVDYDPEYARKQEAITTSQIDRTELWLKAQFAYLRGVGFEPAEPAADIGPEPALPKIVEESEADVDDVERAPTPPPKDGEQLPKPAAPLVRKKTVRFSSNLTSGPSSEPNLPKDLPSKLLKQESAYYRAFQSMTVAATQADVFVHRTPRFEALQAQRVSLREQHRAQLLGKYQLSTVPQSAKKRMSANVARGDDVIFDDPEKLRADKEAEAVSQTAVANWHVAATKTLNGGRLVCAPVHKRLNRLSLAPGAARNNRLRILDLGGQSTCDWAWHAAHQYPNAKVYTVTTKSIRQLSNSNVRGPPNHRQVAVRTLACLPFADAQFDLVSARELHSILKNSDVADAEDEWDATLRECMRVLKPGGYIDFSVMDADVVNAGPLGLAKSVEFGFTLKTLGYDASPTKTFLPRLARAGFENVRRGWVVLPLGPKPADKPGPVRYGPKGPVDAAPKPPTGGETLCLDAMATASLPGSTDGAAAIAGLAGTWAWERWILRCEMEKAAGEMHSGFKLADTVTTDGGVLREASKSLDGVAAVVEEGRACGAGLRLLKGYARKPEVTEFDEVMGTIDMYLDF